MQELQQRAVESLRLFDICHVSCTGDDFQSRATDFPMHQLRVRNRGDLVMLTDNDQSRRDYAIQKRRLVNA